MEDPATRLAQDFLEKEVELYKKLRLAELALAAERVAKAEAEARAAAAERQASDLRAQLAEERQRAWRVGQPPELHEASALIEAEVEQLATQLQAAFTQLEQQRILLEAQRQQLHVLQAGGVPHNRQQQCGSEGCAALGAASSTAPAAPPSRDNAARSPQKLPRACMALAPASCSAATTAAAREAPGAEAGPAVMELPAGAAGADGQAHDASNRLRRRPARQSGWQPVSGHPAPTAAMPCHPLAGAAGAAALASGLPQQPAAATGLEATPAMAGGAALVRAPTEGAPVAGAARAAAAVPGCVAPLTQPPNDMRPAAPVQLPWNGAANTAPAPPQSLCELQQCIAAAAALGGGGGDSLFLDLGGAELPLGPLPPQSRGVLHIACGVPVTICNGTLPACVVVEGPAPAVFKNVTLRAVPWRQEQGGWLPAADAVVTAAGARAVLVMIGCRVEVAAAAGVASPDAVQYSRHAVLVKHGAGATLEDCAVTGAHPHGMQLAWSVLESIGVAAQGAGSSVCARGVQVVDCVHGFKAHQSAVCVAVDCTAVDCSNSFCAGTGGRMWCGSRASVESYAAAAPGTPVAFAAASFTAGTGGGVSPASSSGSSCHTSSSGCRAVGSLLNGFAVSDAGSLLEVLDDCRAERTAGPGCMARDGAELRVSGFTSVGDQTGFLADGAVTRMELRGGCVVRQATVRGLDVQDQANMVVRPRQGPMPAAGLGLQATPVAGAARAAPVGAAPPPQQQQRQERWDVEVDGCTGEGFLANAGTLVLGAGARVVARGCGGDGFTVAGGGLLKAATAAACVAERCGGYGFCAEDSGSRLLLGNGVCVAVGSKDKASYQREGGVVKGALQVLHV
ncbi:hypothetical protein HYH02_005880 [Chlamydomonas schloesseri]|uniref:Uncharacterized protein n=1 Tax=Chlamydomonas schloesseri TaxID=2026947 RepID=A0A835WKL6_9CHLO|nr:hypothetical protein HYH02_005880 [Chlamydomonas schloesseri]|eukprot:KAG2449132.1 hypothetical protein HYH02_005880 [Chlamydomonas schloesseri]